MDEGEEKRMNLKIQGKYALVTGGTHGIGRSIALALADEGCHVAVCSRTKERVAETVKELESRGVSALGIQADVMREKDIRKVMQKVIGEWGTLHILVNNVGGGGRWGKEIIEETEERVWLEVFNKNVLAAVRFTMSAIGYMRKQKWGRVVTVTSIYGRETGGRPWYCMAKTAQTSLMKSLAKYHYLVRDGITFNSVALGLALSLMGWDESKKKKDTCRKFIHEFSHSGACTVEVAAVVVFSVLRGASLLNGVSLP